MNSHRILAISVLFFMLTIIIMGAVNAHASILNGVKDTGTAAYEPLTEDYGGIPQSPILIAAKIINIALGLVGIVFVILTLYAGARWMLSRGNEDEVSKAKDTLKNVTIGLLIILAGYSISYFIVSRVEVASGVRSPEGDSVRVDMGVNGCEIIGGCGDLRIDDQGRINN